MENGERDSVGIGFVCMLVYYETNISKHRLVMTNIPTLYWEWNSTIGKECFDFHAVFSWNPVLYRRNNKVFVPLYIPSDFIKFCKLFSFVKNKPNVMRNKLRLKTVVHFCEIHT